MKKLFKLVLLGVILGPGLWLYLTPYLAVHEMRLAAQKGDEDAVSQYVNYAVLRANLKSQFETRLQQEMHSATNPVGALGAGIASAFVGPMVDGLVKPESLAQLMRGQRHRLLELKEASKDNAGSASAPQPKAAETDVVSHYQSFDRFIVSIKRTASNDAPVEMLFQREGLIHWRLISIRLPL